MEELFKQVEQIVRQVQETNEESRKRGEQFNIFGVCGVNHYENTHSRIIAELLNPQGSHGQGSIFLDAFLASLNTDINFLLDRGARVFTEYTTTEGRIDILITNPHGQSIIIENKIYAQDQPEQLKRYNDYAYTKYGMGNYVILYLTLMGDEASEQSSEGVRYTPLSYASNIVEWLEDCIHISTRLPIIRETLIQYQNHILGLTNQTMDRTGQEKLFATMMKHAEETEAIINAASNGFFEYVWECKVEPAFEEFAADNNLHYVKLGTCIYFHCPVWKKTSIKICSWGGRQYIGVSCTEKGGLEDLSQLPKQKLACLSNNPNDWWPYGWQWLDPYDSWSPGSGIIQAMIDGRFADFMMGRVKEILNEIEEKNIKMI